MILCSLVLLSLNPNSKSNCGCNEEGWYCYDRSLLLLIALGRGRIRTIPAVLRSTLLQHQDLGTWYVERSFQTNISTRWLVVG
jgi:hypothetical protein